MELQNPLHKAQINAGDSLGRTPLHWAALNGDCLGVKTLLRYGADPNAVDHRHFPPLHPATMRSSLSCVESLLAAGADVSARDNYGGQAIHTACRWQINRAIIDVLINAGALVQSEDNQSDTPLYFAVAGDRYDNAAFLLQKGADINHRNRDGQPALFEALLQHNHAILELLLSKGADYTIVDTSGIDILQYTAIYADIESTQILLRTGLRGLDSGRKDRKGRTALEMFRERPVVSDEFTEVFEQLFQSVGAACKSQVVEVIDQLEGELYVDAVETQQTF